MSDESATGSHILFCTRMRKHIFSPTHRIYLTLLSAATVVGCSGQATAPAVKPPRSAKAEARTAGIMFRDVAAEAGVRFRWPRQPRPCATWKRLDLDAPSWTTMATDCKTSSWLPNLLPVSTATGAPVSLMT